MASVFAFDHVHARPPRQLKDLLGGKGANLAEMTSVLGLPVPPGFTVTTEACRAYMKGGLPDGLLQEVYEHLSSLEQAMGRPLGHGHDPLLVSVRSGAKFSMPGMMDTVLDLGLNDESVRGFAEASNPHLAYDSYRRFISMYARIVLGLEGEPFEAALEAARREAKVRTDAELPEDELKKLCDGYKGLVRDATGRDFPEEPKEQLRGAIEAVFRSWSSPRAIAYRRRERIPNDLGTAVNVQAMVFGNRDEQSGTGVAFTRNPATGAKGAYGDFLTNAQGEDVVAGIRNTEPLSAIEQRFPAVYDELLAIFERLESHYRDMLDTEFTIESGKLWMLQVRVGKRTGTAALAIAVDMAEDPRMRLSPQEAVLKVKPEHLDQVLHPHFAPHDRAVLTTGLAASPGAAVGRVYFDADEVVAAHERGERTIMVRTETSPDDVRGLQVAEGVLTSRGGLVSHAAVVARGWGKPAVCGAHEMTVSRDRFVVGDTTVKQGDLISIDGSTGDVILGEVPLEDPKPPEAFDKVLSWADSIRRGKLGVRANADNAADATRARDFGAEGIGLCRTEHMFLGQRLPIVQKMILADTEEEEARALEALREAQREDFTALLEAMDGLPVTVRLLDPPLHEFLPDVEELVVKEARGQLDEEGKELLGAARYWAEENPMLGTRGVRLGIIKTGLYRMQVRALLQAVAKLRSSGKNPIVEVMVPLVVTKDELARVRTWVEEEVEAASKEAGDALDVHVGTMIETPRAALVADDIADVADFFSFGTNDLTQMTFGFSRDDIEGTIMSRYLKDGILPHNPFESLDVRGVGQLVQMAVSRGRQVRPRLKIGVCGEHGGDPASIAFFYEAGLDYVSCSPFRVPVARLSAAHAVLAGRAS